MTGEVLQQTQKIQFETLDHTHRQALGMLLLGGIKIYLYGMHNRRAPELRELATTLLEESVVNLRSFGEHVAATYEIESEHVSSMVGMWTQEAMGWDNTPIATRDWVAGRVAEGLYEGGQQELARSVYETCVRHPEVQPNVLEYFRRVDGQLQRTLPSEVI